MSYEIVEIFKELVDEVSKNLVLNINGVEVVCPKVNYLFGSGQYFKDNIDEQSEAVSTNAGKFPVICLFAPILEDRDNVDYYTTAKVSLLIACSTRHEWSNEQRLEYSFKNILRPIYKRLLEVMLADKRLDFGYEKEVKHQYSENYSYGRYGAVDENGKAISEPIDAINIKRLEIRINKKYCKR